MRKDSIISHELTASGQPRRGAGGPVSTPAATPGARQAIAPAAHLFGLSLTEEQKSLIDTVREFARTRVRPAAAATDSACAVPAELPDAADALGITGLGVPPEFDGPLQQRSSLTAALIAEALAHGDMGIALACMAPGGVATALGLWGDTAQQARYLPRFASTTPPRAAVALLEGRPLADPFVLSTRASTTADGGYLLDGVKALVPGGATTELLLVAAELEHRPSLFLVEPSAAGVSATPAPAMGVRAAATANVTLDHVRLERGARLGESNPEVYSELVARGRLAWCALAVGTGQAVLDYTRDYARERIAFGEPIADRQSVAFTIAQMAVELDGLRLATWRAATLADAGRKFAREAALARILVERYAARLGSDGVQLLGGHGYTRAHPVERWYRDLQACALMEGALAL